MTAWVIAAPASGSGKTSITLGLARACARRGLSVQCFKVGPDYLDPGWLERASGQPCLNLDPWMSGDCYVRDLFARIREKNDVVLVEGVMGLFDGASIKDLDGSTAAVARLLDLPILFVVPAKGMARSLAATVRGFHDFEPGVRIGGVIANFVGSDSHARLLKDVLHNASLPSLLGALPAGAMPELPSRHLGLYDAGEMQDFQDRVEEMANAVERFVDVDDLIGNLRPESRSVIDTEPFRAPSVRIGIASDAAFRFVYPDNLRALEEAGVRWVPFSPLRDRELPSHLDGLYFPGGYPEAHAWTLAANRTFLDSLRVAADEGIPIYAECGGLMYLTRGLTDSEGVFHAWAGLLPTAARMLPRRKALGYAEIRTRVATCWGPPGQTLRGHEFHYSELEDSEVPGWESPYWIKTRQGEAAGAYRQGRVLASYVHLHWAAHSGSCRHFVRYMQGAHL